MLLSKEEILEAFKKLETADQLSLAEDVFELVPHEENEDEFSEEEIEEFDKRVEEIRSGKVKAISAEEFMASTEALLERLKDERVQAPPRG